MINNCENKIGKALIAGMGKTGYSCANFLASRNVEFSVADSRDFPPMLEQFMENYRNIEIKLGGFDLRQLDGIEMLVVSPGIPMDTDLVKCAIDKKKEVVGDIELFARFAEAPIIAITGSNGKSTVTTLLGEMIKECGLNAAVGGNLGTPALDLLTQEVPDYYVLEVSSFQLDLTQKLSTVSSVVLNISADHLDRYASFDDYINSKLKIYRLARACVVNKDDDRINSVAEKNQKVTAFTSGLADDYEFGIAPCDGDVCLMHGKKPLVAGSELRIFGMHNYINVLAAFALGHTIGLPVAYMVSAAKKFRGLAHRCEFIGEQNGVKWFNDSKATNVAATAASVSSMIGSVVLIVGGVTKDTNFNPLIEIAKEKVKAIILMGQDALLIEDMLKECVPIKHARSMREAVGLANEMASKGENVLLAPACASFDMYKDYEARGNDFVASARDIVRLG